MADGAAAASVQLTPLHTVLPIHPLTHEQKTHAHTPTPAHTHDMDMAHLTNALGPSTQ